MHIYTYLGDIYITFSLTLVPILGLVIFPKLLNALAQHLPEKILTIIVLHPIVKICHKPIFEAIAILQEPSSVLAPHVPSVPLPRSDPMRGNQAGLEPNPVGDTLDELRRRLAVAVPLHQVGGLVHYDPGHLRPEWSGLEVTYVLVCYVYLIVICIGHKVQVLNYKGYVVNPLPPGLGILPEDLGDELGGLMHLLLREFGSDFSLESLPAGGVGGFVDDEVVDAIDPRGTDNG